MLLFCAILKLDEYSKLDECLNLPSLFVTLSLQFNWDFYVLFKRKINLLDFGKIFNFQLVMRTLHGYFFSQVFVQDLILHDV